MLANISEKMYLFDNQICEYCILGKTGKSSDGSKNLISTKKYAFPKNMYAKLLLIKFDVLRECILDKI